MDLESKIRSEYLDILGSQSIADFNGDIKTHTVIKFDQYLKRKFPNETRFIEQNKYGRVYQKMINKYWGGIGKNDTSFFQSFGVLKTISIDKLKFYQPTVGINGPKYSSINEPVLIIENDDVLILFEGYHRILTKIELGIRDIQGFVLTLI